MKKINFLILAILFAFSSCYIYKPYQFKEVESVSATQKGGPVSLRSDMDNEKGKVSVEQRRRAEEAEKTEKSKMELKTEMDLKTPDLTEKERMELEEKEQANKNAFTKSDGTAGNEKPIVPKTPNLTSDSNIDSIKIKMKPNKYYRITVEEKRYKIQTEQWEGDTLVSHVLRRPEKVLRFHKDQIDEESLEERRFSKPLSDLITVGSYVTGGVAILLLVL